MSDSSGDMPDWLRQHKETPVKTFLASTSSDDDQPLTLGLKQARLPVEQGAPAAATEAAAAAAAAASQAEPLAEQHAKGAVHAPHGERPGAAAAAAVAAAAATATPGGGLQVKGVLPIVMPDKLNKNKVLLELPAGQGASHAATDLSGDAGAVGRLIVPKQGAGDFEGCADASASSLQVDLKGVIYNAWVLPLAASAFVLNIGPTQAKVESLFNDFVRLREAPDPYAEEGGEAGGEGLAYLLGDDDEEGYQPGDGGAAEAADGEGGKAGGKGAKTKGAKAAAKPEAAKPRKKAGGGADKKDGGKKAGGKKAGGGGGAKASGKGKALGVKGGGVVKKKGDPAARKKAPAASSGAKAAAVKPKGGGKGAARGK